MLAPMGFKKVGVAAARKAAITTHPRPPEVRDKQIHARVAASDIARLERIYQLSGMGFSEAMRRGLLLVEQELLARHDRVRSTKGRKR